MVLLWLLLVRGAVYDFFAYFQYDISSSFSPDFNVFPSRHGLFNSGFLFFSDFYFQGFTALSGIAAALMRTAATYIGTGWVRTSAMSNRFRPALPIELQCHIPPSKTVCSGFGQAFRGPVERVRICTSHSIFSALCAHTLRGPYAWTTCVYLFRHRSYVRFPLRLSHHQSVTYTVFTGSVSYGSFQRVSASDRHSATASASMTGGCPYSSPVPN